ncbi:MAG: flagellar export chaperone FliS [Oscillospiraceae bacterium]|nr:flagellar export chaperone FliS [Oscillospiraceae bacterium]
MDANGLQQQYKRDAVDTMTQGELLLMLYDELIKRLTRADLALAKEEYETFEASVDRCLEIVWYLDDTLDKQYPISANLTKLYDFFCYELNRVKIGRNKTELDRVRTMIGELRDSFRTAQQNNDSGK